ncbi:hypothetical protein ACFZAM_00470 [Streptomyces sp. NPDC008079]|uniref:hypothetical protein n=1 Tax=Streptomyces sp. NPDC008079 TaxID=3364806 RepID=UPI0036EFD808
MAARPRRRDHRRGMLGYMPTDYQPEAAAAAVAEWSARECGFPPPAVEVTFHREGPAAEGSAFRTRI